MVAALLGTNCRGILLLLLHFRKRRGLADTDGLSGCALFDRNNGWMFMVSVLRFL